jgi:hypothetical protein
MQQDTRPKRDRREEPPLPGWDDEPAEGALPILRADTLSAEQLQDLLNAIPDRADLERLFERNVTIGEIVQLLGRNVNRRDIQNLLMAEDVRSEVRRLLSELPRSQ